MALQTDILEREKERGVDIILPEPLIQLKVSKATYLFAKVYVQVIPFLTSEHLDFM